MPAAAVIVFPGSNCDRDIAVALEAALGHVPHMVWHGDSTLPKVDLIAVPGGFSYGDYLRSGAMAANSPIMREVVTAAARGTPVLGICNGFQVLTECGLLPGVLMRNASLKFICRDVDLRVERNDTVFTRGYAAGQVIRVPVAHHDGNYFADPDTLKDPKTRLQEWLQGRSRPRPEYEVLEISGPEHQQRFRVCCRLDDGNEHVEGNGASRRGAEQNAARAMLEKLDA